MIRKLGILACLLTCGNALADSASVPIAIVLPENMAANATSGAPSPLGLVGGLVTAWTDSAMNKRSEKDAKRFYSVANDTPYAELVKKQLACIGVPEGTTGCRRVIDLPEAKNEKELGTRLKESGVPRVLIVHVIPMLDDARFRVRAQAREFDATDKGIKLRRAYLAIYDTRAPDTAIAAAKVKGANTDTYWLEGSPARISTEAEGSVAEVLKLLSFLDQNVPESGEPEIWKSFEKIDALEKSGRINCSGLACNNSRFVKDFGSRLWFANKQPFGDKGYMLVSLDETSAKHHTNMLVFAVAAE